MRKIISEGRGGREERKAREREAIKRGEKGQREEHEEREREVGDMR